MKAARLDGLGSQVYVRYFLDACGRAGGVPGDLAPFLPWDWEDAYGYRPVLLETFVDGELSGGTCYRGGQLGLRRVH